MRYPYALVAVLFVLAGNTPLAFGQPAKTAENGTTPTSEPPPDFELTLKEAYEKEFAFLVSQKRQLQERVKSAGERSKRQEASVEAEINRLETRLLGVEDSLQEARELVQASDEEAQSVGDEQQLVGATLEQATTSLSDYEADLPSLESEDEGGPSAEAVEGVFAAAVQTLQTLSSVRQEDGQEFFLQDGTKADGTIIHVGRIAAYGVSDSGSGALVPAGGGKLKVWKDPAAESARALMSGTPPETLGIFLYESLDGRVDEQGEQTVVEHIDAGGIIAWVIIGLGALGLILSAIRAAILSTSGGNEQKVLDQIAPLVEMGRLDEAAETAGAIRGSAARVSSSVFRSLARSSERIDEALSEAMLGEGRHVQRFGMVILVIAAVSPLLGLLGTVTGMISTFDVITKFGTGDPKMLSGGISTALITTELGLVVAIPTLLLGNILKGWAEGIESRAERTALRLVTLHTGAAPKGAVDVADIAP